MFTKYGKVSLVCIIILFISSCNLFSPPRPEDALVGHWKYVTHNNGYDAFQYDIDFYEDGTLNIPSPFLLTNVLEYSVPQSGQLKLTAGSLGSVVKYTLDGNTLRIYFTEEGYNEYKKD